jgi:hypothetical protein
VDLDIDANNSCLTPHAIHQDRTGKAWLWSSSCDAEGIVGAKVITGGSRLSADVDGHN